jgi:tRNA A-37 threonylcarbamoyl transferase component Bud32
LCSSPPDKALREVFWWDGSEAQVMAESEVPASTRLSELPVTTDTGATGSAADAPAPLARSADWPKLPGYELLDLLGAGGMGVVFKARHLASGKVVALKTMRADALGSAEQAGRFEREVRATALLRHPHIVPTHDIGRTGSQPFYTMAFVPGGSLAQQRERLHADPWAAMALLEKVARAVHYAHSQGVVHRDLKPSNVLLDEGGEPLVSDFGLAKFPEGDIELTQTGAVLGTPAYMAPEQADGRTKDVGVGTDIWALGVMLYELLAGRRPFAGENTEEVKRHIREQTPARLRALRPGLSPAVEKVVLGCLEKEPRRRYRSAGELAEALRRCREDPALLAQPGRRAVPGWRRWRWLAGLGLLGLAGAVVAALLLSEGAPDGPKPPGPAGPAPEQVQEIRLLGSSGPPEKFRWVLGKNEATVQPTAAGQPFAFGTTSRTLLELRPDVPWAGFRLEARVRQEPSQAGQAGIYFGYHRSVTPAGVHHCFASLAFSDFGADGGRVALGLSAVKELDEPVAVAGQDLVVRLVPAAELGPGGGWHRLAVEVSAREVRAFWDGTWIGSRSRDTVDGRPESFRAVGWRFDPRGPVGLCATRTAASFKDVMVRPLP